MGRGAARPMRPLIRQGAIMIQRSATPVAAGTRARARASSRREAVRGWAFVTPTTLLLLVLFIVPIGLVLVMSGSEWSLLGGNRGQNFPENYTRVFDDPLLGTSVWFTIRYTVLTT